MLSPDLDPYRARPHPQVSNALIGTLAVALDVGRERLLNHQRLDGFQDCLALGQGQSERLQGNGFSLESGNLVNFLLVTGETPEFDFEFHVAPPALFASPRS